MEKKILDDDLILQDKNKVEPKLLNWVSILILWLGIGYCLFEGIITDMRVIAGIVLLVIATLATYFKFELGVKITLGIIVIGVFSLVKYVPISYSCEFGFGVVGFAFELVILFIGIIHYFTNRAVLYPFLNGMLNRKVSVEESLEEERKRINGYKHQFSRKSMEELKSIIENKKLLPEAIKAAEELIEKRKA
jgi:hypothetical protein